MRIPLIFALMLTLVGCTKGMLHVGAIKPSMDNIIERHDRYVANDEALPPVAKDAFLRESELAKKVLTEAAKP